MSEFKLFKIIVGCVVLRTFEILVTREQAIKRAHQRHNPNIFVNTTEGEDEDGLLLKYAKDTRHKKIRSNMRKEYQKIWFLKLLNSDPPTAWVKDYCQQNGLDYKEFQKEYEYSPLFKEIAQTILYSIVADIFRVKKMGVIKYTLFK